MRQLVPRGSAASRICGWTRRSSTIAASRVCPFRSRAMMVTGRPSSPRSRDACPNGTATSTVRPTSTPEKRGGVTPTMVNGTPSRAQGATDRVSFPAKSALPEAVADDRHGAVGTTAGTVIGSRERPAEQRRNAERLEIRSADPHTRGHLRLTSRRQIEFRGRPRQRPIEMIHVSPKRVPDGIRVTPNAGHRAVRNQHERARIRHGEMAEQEAVDQRKDGRVGADAERQ